MPKEEIKEEIYEIYREIEKRRDIEAPLREWDIKKVKIRYFLEMLPIIIFAEAGLFKLLGSLLDGFIIFASAILFIALLCLYDHLVECHMKLIEKDQLISLCYKLLGFLDKKLFGKEV